MSKVVELPRATVANISRVLRAIADSIDDGEYGEVILGGVILENSHGNIEIFGAGGACDTYRMLALMALGKDQLIKQHRGDA